MKRYWKRVLYENQPFPDNFVDQNRFFDQLDFNNKSDDVDENGTAAAGVVDSTISTSNSYSKIANDKSHNPSVNTSINSNINIAGKSSSSNFLNVDNGTSSEIGSSNNTSSSGSCSSSSSYSGNNNSSNSNFNSTSNPATATAATTPGATTSASLLLSKSIPGTANAITPANVISLDKPGTTIFAGETNDTEAVSGDSGNSGSSSSNNNKSANRREHYCFSLTKSASVVTQQLSVVAVFLATYKYMMVYKDDTGESLYRLIAFDGLLLVIGHIFHRVFDVSVVLQPSLLESSRGVFLFGVCLRVAVPVVQTLTSSFSSNTIHALAIALSAIHLVFYDYGFVHDGAAEQFSGTLSLNASMFTAVILASRLDDVETVFSFMLLAVICFSFYPIVAQLIYRRSLVLHLAVTVVQCLMAGGLLLFLDFPLFVIFMSLVMFIWIVCPLWLKHMQSYKKSLKGPWDIVDIATL